MSELTAIDRASYAAFARCDHMNRIPDSPLLSMCCVRAAVAAATPHIEAEVREQVMRELIATTITQSTPLAEYRRQVEAAALRNAANVLWQRAERERAEYRNRGQSIEYINGIEVASEALDQLADGLDGGASSG